MGGFGYQFFWQKNELEGAKFVLLLCKHHNLGGISGVGVGC